MELVLSRRKMKDAGVLGPGGWCECVSNLGIEGASVTINNIDQFKPLYYRVRT